MMFKTFAVAAITLGLATSAFAQSSGNGAGEGGKGDSPAKMWDGAISDVFFTDSTGGKLRPEAEVTQRWGQLSDAQKETVRGDCKTMSADSPTGPMAEACNWVKAQPM